MRVSWRRRLCGQFVVVGVGSVEPGPLLAVLSLQLAVVLRVVGGAVQEQDVVLAEHVTNLVGAVHARPVHAENEGSAMLLDVLLEQGGNGGAVIDGSGLDAGAEADGRVRESEDVLCMLRATWVHGVEAAQHAGHHSSIGLRMTGDENGGNPAV
jgi:hypothetical protein